MESYDFLRQYELESGSRVCWCTLSSKISAAPLSIQPIYRIGEQQVWMRNHMTVFWRGRSVGIVGGIFFVAGRLYTVSWFYCASRPCGTALWVPRVPRMSMIATVMAIPTRSMMMPNALMKAQFHE